MREDQDRDVEGSFIHGGDRSLFNLLKCPSLNQKKINAPHICLLFVSLKVFVCVCVRVHVHCVLTLNFFYQQQTIRLFPPPTDECSAEGAVHQLTVHSFTCRKTTEETKREMPPTFNIHSLKRQDLV